MHRPLPRARRALTALALPALLAAGSLPVLGQPAASAAPQAAATSTTTTASTVSTSELHKDVRDLTHPGANPVNHGDELGWVIGYTDSAIGPSDATVTDVLAGAPATQTYLPDSLHVPPQWTPQWSTDGTSFTTVDHGAATTAVRALKAGAQPGGTDVEAAFTRPIQQVATATGGDGFSPVLHRTAAGGLEAWNIFHHGETPPSTPKLVCTDLATGALCAGGPWPRPLNVAPGPLGTGNTGEITTALIPQYAFDPARPDQLLYPAITATAVGVGCVDLAARANCGFVALENRGAVSATSGVNGVTGVVLAAGNAYAVATTGQVLCMAVSSRTPCAGQPYAAVVPGNADAPGAGATNYQGAMAVVDGRVYVASSPPAASVAVGCFDPATATACAGWSPARTVGPAGFRALSLYPDLDTTGHGVGVCATVSGGTTQIGCLAVDGTVLPSPPGLAPPASGGLVAANPLTVTGPDGDVRGYFPLWGGPLPGDTQCYDWTRAQPCAGFPNPAGHPTVNGGATRDYGYDYDPASQCLFGLGDAGVLFSVNPVDGTSPCLSTGAAADLDPSAFYCDGAAGHVRAYRDARIEGIDLSHVNLGASSVDVTDPDGTPVASPPLGGADGVVDLSGVSVQEHPAIRVNVHLALTSAADFGAGAHPTLVVSFDGDPPQVCLRTTVAADCAVTQVTDTATGTDGTGPFTSNTVTLPVAPGPGCQPKVTVNKEICASYSDYDCGPYGDGPWVKKSPAGLLGLLGEAHWRITVTNAGPVGVTGVRLYDPAEPSCEYAAGTFDLPAGASRHVFCESLLLVLPFTNTAKASFLPQNSPYGTTPTTTASSSATACGLLCILTVQPQHTYTASGPARRSAG